MTCRLLLAIFLAVGSLATAWAQPYPQRPVKVIVPFPAGGGIDVLMRAIAEELSQKWGKPVIIENRGGAGGNIGAEAAARADPDGHTLLATVNQTFTANRFFYRMLPYDLDRSFAPITLMVQSDYILIAHPSVPPQAARELVQFAKREPGKFTYGSFDSGSPPPERDQVAPAISRNTAPLSRVRLDYPETGRVYECRLVLVRSDGHVACRDDEGPHIEEMLRVVDTARKPAKTRARLSTKET